MCQNNKNRALPYVQCYYVPKTAAEEPTDIFHEQDQIRCMMPSGLDSLDRNSIIRKLGRRAQYWENSC